MPRNAFLDETKSGTWPIPPACFNGFDKVRIQPTVGAVLDEAKGSFVGRGDFLIHGSLRFALIAAIVAGNLPWVYATVGRLLGYDTTSVMPPHNGGR